MSSLASTAASAVDAARRSRQAAGDRRDRRRRDRQRVAVVGTDLEHLRGGAPPMIAVPLNFVCVAMRVISLESCWYSASRLARSPVPFEPFCACTASSRMRCRASVMVASAPSAVWASEMPSLALRIATLVPRICAFMRSAIARPAASSAPS